MNDEQLGLAVRYEALSNNFLVRIKEEFARLGNDYHSKLTKDLCTKFNLKQSTASLYLGGLSQGHPYYVRSFLPVTRDRRIWKCIPKQNLKSKDKVRLNRTAVLLGELNIPQDDSLVAQIQELYPSFRYQGKSEQEIRGKRKGRRGVIALDEREIGLLRTVMEREFGSVEGFCKYFESLKHPTSALAKKKRYLDARDVMRVLNGQIVVGRNLADSLDVSFKNNEGIEFLRSIFYGDHPSQLGLKEKPTETPRPSKELEQIVDSTVNILFTGEERNRIVKQISRARLSLRGGWASIPKLNLGAVKLPSPGMKDITQDQFVIEATPYVAEYLDALGIMNENMENVMTQRLLNYFVHHSGFQLNKGRAESIVQQLRANIRKPKVA